MEDNWCPVQPHGDDDGDATAVDNSPAQDDARPRDQERHGGNASQDERPVTASWYVRDADKLPGRRGSFTGPEQEESSSEATTEIKHDS